MDGQIIFGGGQLNDVILAKAVQGVGDSLSIHLSEAGDSPNVWTFLVDVHLAQGKFRLGSFSTLTPLSGEPSSRTVALAYCPGAIGWSVQVSTPDNGENVIAGVTLDSSTCCSGGVIGVEPVAQTSAVGGDPPWLFNFSTALANSFVIRPAPGVIRSITLRVDSTLATATYYVQLWNAIAVPADGTAVTLANSLAAPVKIQHVNGVDSNVRYDFNEGGERFSVGASLNLSSTEFTKTTVAGAFMSVINAEYR